MSDFNRPLYMGSTTFCIILSIFVIYASSQLPSDFDLEDLFKMVVLFSPILFIAAVISTIGVRKKVFVTDAEVVYSVLLRSVLGLIVSTVLFLAALPFLLVVK